MRQAITIGLLAGIALWAALICENVREIRRLAYIECLDREYPHMSVCD